MNSICVWQEALCDISFCFCSFFCDGAHGVLKSYAVIRMSVLRDIAMFYIQLLRMPLVKFPCLFQ